MPPTTEIARVRLNSPTAIKSDAFQGSLSTLSKQPGYVGTSYGMGIEDGDLLYWLVGMLNCGGILTVQRY
jgi:hypothetical protein